MINFIKHRIEKINLIFILIIIISLNLGIIIGHYFLKEEIDITYISQDELLELEKARLAKENSSKRELFYGSPKEAIQLIEAIQTTRSTGNRIVLLSEKAIYGRKVKSISNEVHKEILEHLKNRPKSQSLE